MYDDPVNTARRLLTIHKDQPWARGELADLVPLLLDEIEERDCKDRDNEELKWEVKELEKRIENLEEENDSLEEENVSLTLEIDRLENMLADANINSDTGLRHDQ